MKLDNQKNGWKGVCVYQEADGDPLNSLTTIWVRKTFGREQKTPAPKGSYDRNSPESTVNNQQNSTTNITTMVRHLPLLQLEFNELLQSDGWGVKNKLLTLQRN